MSVRTDITPKAIALAAEQQRTEAHLAGVKANDLVAARDVAARDMEEVERQLTWWKSRSPQAQVIPLLQDGYERYAQRVNEAGARAADAARAQQDHERAAAELDALALAAQAEWEQRKARPADATRSDLTADDHPDPAGPARTSQDDTGPDRTETGRMVADTGYPTAPANGPEAAQ